LCDGGGPGSRRGGLTEVRRLESVARGGDLCGRPGEPDLTVHEHDRVVGDLEREVRVLLDENDDGAGVGDPPHDRQQLLHDHGREAHAHLVDEQHARSLHQPAREREHLLLTTRERAGRDIPSPLE